MAATDATPATEAGRSRIELAVPEAGHSDVRDEGAPSTVHS